MKQFIQLFLVIALMGCTSNDPINNSVKTSGSLAVAATTSTYNGTFSPSHVLAVWVESSSGTFVKTLALYGRIRTGYLSNWYGATSSGNTVDATTGATLHSHGAFSFSWNGKDINENVVGDGTYRVCVEFTEHDGTGKIAKFAFTKGTVIDTQNPGT